MNKGKVKFFNEGKGFGFIIDDKNQQEVFVHTSDLKNVGRLTKDDKVSYDTKEGKKGLQATNVTVIGE